MRLRLIDPLVVTGPWKRLVFGHPAPARSPRPPTRERRAVNSSRQ
ncbi:hypothetical protein [Nonomuraea sp. B19D2]